MQAQVSFYDAHRPPGNFLVKMTLSAP